MQFHTSSRIDPSLALKLIAIGVMDTSHELASLWIQRRKRAVVEEFSHWMIIMIRITYHIILVEREMACSSIKICKLAAG